MKLKRKPSIGQEAAMWSELLPSGRVRFKERFRNPLTGKDGTVSVTADKETNVTRKAAEAALQRKIQEKLSSPVATDVYSLRCIYDAYVKDQKAHIKPSTWSRNERVLMKVIEGLGTDLPTDKLTAGLVKRSFPSTPSTFNERLTRFKAMMRWAYENDMAENIGWIDKIKPMSDTRKERIQDKYLEKEELRNVLDAMKISSWRLLTEFLALTGLRIGEAIALTESDVSLQDRTITVSKTYCVTLEELLSSAKTETSNRVISIQDELVPVIRDIHSLVESYPAASMIKLFFPAPDGGYLHYNSYRQYLEDTTERVIGRRLTPHALRHTMTSLFAEAGVPLETITRRLGHADSSITKKIYLHITKKQEERDAALIRSVKII